MHKRVGGKFRPIMALGIARRWGWAMTIVEPQIANTRSVQLKIHP
jgi:hypothetical protein